MAMYELAHIIRTVAAIGRELAALHSSTRYVTDVSGKVLAVQLDPTVYQALLVAALGLDRLGTVEGAVRPTDTEQQIPAPDP